MDTDVSTAPSRAGGETPPRVFPARMAGRPATARTAAAHALTPLEFDWLLDRYRARPGRGAARPGSAPAGER
jgi:hypothetical protein